MAVATMDVGGERGQRTFVEAAMVVGGKGAVGAKNQRGVATWTSDYGADGAPWTDGEPSVVPLTDEGKVVGRSA